MKRLLLLFLLGVFFTSGLATAGEWHEKVKLSGDFRHRHELIQDESKDEDRTRWRVRLRLALSADITESWAVHTRLATGSDDPVSTNQTMTSGFATKGFHIDRAYIDFHPSALKGVSFVGGKMGLPFVTVEKTELIWDSDLSPEGAALKAKHKPSEKVELMASGGFFYIEERKQDNDTWMAGGQGAFKVVPKDDVHFLAGVGYYDYEEVKDREGVYDPEDFFGNTTVEVGEGEDAHDVYAYDYNLFEFFGEIGFKIEKVSLKLYGNFVTNTDPDSANTGYLFGATIKHGKDLGNVKFYANYREVESDAVIGAFTDSDFGGGGTDANGLEIGGSVGVAKSIDLALTFFYNNKGIVDEIEYKRLQVDLKGKF